MLKVRLRYTKHGKMLSFLSFDYVRTETYRYMQFGKSPTKFVGFSRDRDFPLFTRGVRWKTRSFLWFIFGTTTKPVNFQKVWGTNENRSGAGVRAGGFLT